MGLRAIDGPGNTLGNAGPTGLKSNLSGNALSPNFLYADTAFISFDTDDLGFFEFSGLLDGLFTHQMAHAIGFGLLWSGTDISPSFTGRQEVYVDGSGRYTGAGALAAFNNEFGQDASFIPVELDIQFGRINADWDETGFAADGSPLISSLTGQSFSDELMTSSLDRGAFIGEHTIASFRDIGYTTIPLAVDAIPEPSALVLVAVGTACCGLRRRRKVEEADRAGFDGH